MKKIASMNKNEILNTLQKVARVQTSLLNKLAGADIDVQRNHTLGKEIARTKAQELVKNMEGSLGLTWSWTGDNINFKSTSGKASGTKGTVFVTDNQIRVTVDLPFMLNFFSGKIKNKINESLDRLVTPRPVAPVAPATPATPYAAV